MTNPPICACRAAAWVLAGLVAAGCAGSGREVVTRLESDQVEMRDEIEALKRAVEASYDRESAMAERLRLAEEAGAETREALRRQSEERATRGGRPEAAPEAPAATRLPAAFQAGDLNLRQAYPAALSSFNDHQYEVAFTRFAEIVAAAPTSDLADNAQYWMGECYYGLGKFRQALVEFTKVFAYQGTEKDDDAQFKIARCHLALGEKGEALAAFQKLLSGYPDSEYAERSRREIRYLQGP